MQAPPLDWKRWRASAEFNRRLRSQRAQLRKIRGSGLALSANGRVEEKLPEKTANLVPHMRNSLSHRGSRLLLTEAGLPLLLLRMKCCFLRLQISDQPGKPFNRNLIANGQEYLPVMLDLFIEFVALVAHGNPQP